MTSKINTMLIASLVLLLCSQQILSAPLFFVTTGNANLDGAIVGAGLGFFAGHLIRQFQTSDSSFVFRRSSQQLRQQPWWAWIQSRLQQMSEHISTLCLWKISFRQEILKTSFWASLHVMLHPLIYFYEL